MIWFTFVNMSVFRYSPIEIAFVNLPRRVCQVAPHTGQLDTKEDNISKLCNLPPVCPNVTLDTSFCSGKTLFYDVSSGRKQVLQHLS